MPCSLCNAQGFNKSTCPLNPYAKHVSKEHSDAAAAMGVFDIKPPQDAKAPEKSYGNRFRDFIAHFTGDVVDEELVEEKKEEKKNKSKMLKSELEAMIVDFELQISKLTDEVKKSKQRMIKIRQEKKRLQDKIEDITNRCIQIDLFARQETDAADLYYSKWLQLKNQDMVSKRPLMLQKPFVEKFILPHKKSWDECPICMDKIDATNYTITHCGHEYHKSCLEEAIKHGTTDTCPMCRS